jgi:hypothetical protein
MSLQTEKTGLGFSDRRFEWICGAGQAGTPHAFAPVYDNEYSKPYAPRPLSTRVVFLAAMPGGTHAHRMPPCIARPMAPRAKRLAWSVPLLAKATGA